MNWAAHTLAVTCMLALPALLPAAAEGQPVSDSSLDAAIRNFVIRNPQIIRDALAKAELLEQIETTKRVLREQADAIYRSGSLTIGASNAKVSVIAFFDYNCPYCRASQPILMQLLQENPDVQVILKDIANLGKDSEAVSRLVIAAKLQERAQALHKALMERKGKNDATVTLDIAQQLGLDIDRLKKDAASTEVTSVLSRTRELASVLSVNGTPLFIIGHDGIAGAPDDLSEKLAKFVGEVRQAGCDVCGP